MTETMRERIARAICHDNVEGCEAAEDGFEACHPKLCQCRRSAGVVLEAMKEPLATARAEALEEAAAEAEACRDHFGGDLPIMDRLARNIRALISSPSKEPAK